MRHGKELITQMIAGLSAELAAEPCKNACTALLTAAGGAGIIAALGPVGAAIVPLTLFGGTTLLQICRQKKVEAKEAEQLQRIQHAMERLATHQNEARQELADLALEQDWLRDAIENGPEAFNAALALMKADFDIALSGLGAKVDDIAETLCALTILSFDTNWRVRTIEANTNTILANQTQHGDMLSKAVDGIAELKDLLLAQGKSREEIEAELRPKLEQEIEAKLRAQHQAMPSAEDPAEAARRLADTAIAALRDKDFATRATEVGSGLAVLESLERDATAHERAADRHIEASIAIWRKTAEWAYLVGEIDKAEAALRRILAFTPNDIDATNRLGTINTLRGEWARAAQLFKRVGELAIDVSWRAASLGNLGVIELARGNLDAAEPYHKKALELNETLGNPEGMAAAYGNLGLIELTRVNLDAAEAYLKKALAIHERLGRIDGMANQHGSLGLIELKRGKLNAAEACLKKSLALNATIGRSEGMAADYTNLCAIEQTRGNMDAAEAYHKKSLALIEKLGNPEGMAAAYGNLGVIELTRGNLDAAETYVKKALVIHERLGRIDGMANQHGNLGLIELKRGKLDSAEAYLKTSLALNVKLGRIDGMAGNHHNLGLIEQNRGNLEAAEAYHKNALALDVKLGCSEDIATDYESLGLIEQTRGNTKEACRLFTLARDLIRKIGAKDREALLQGWLDKAGCEER